MSGHIEGKTVYQTGKILIPPRGAVCDNHPERPAVARMVGDVNALGAILHDYCAECAVREHAYNVTAEPSACDICGRPTPSLQQAVDPHDGASPRIYEACAQCVRDHQLVDPKEVVPEGEEDDDDDEPGEEFTNFSDLR